MKKLYLTIITCLLLSTSYSQDVFFEGTQQLRSYFNPALSGINGSLSFNLLAKNQFLNRTDFITSGFNIEQSFPCANVDGGLYYLRDWEGEGFLNTHHAGMNVAYTIPFDAFHTFQNIRIGTKIQYTFKNVDWEKFTFSDQIDPKYNLANVLGTPNSTSFIPPDWNSASQLTLGVGIIHKLDIGFIDKWSLTWGGAIENYTSIFESSKYDSILRLKNDKNKLIHKWSFYLSPEFPLSHSYRNYLGLKPSFILLKEVSLTHIQIGVDLNFKRAYGLGIYFSSGSLSSLRKNTKSIMFNSFIRVWQNRISQINMGLQYSHNIGGLSQVFGQTLQFSISYIFKKDGCSSTPDLGSDCPQTSKRHNILYENIWIK